MRHLGDRRWVSESIARRKGVLCTSVLHRIDPPEARYAEHLESSTGERIRSERTCVTCHIAMIGAARGMGAHE